MKTNNFDSVAFFYDLLSRVVFGNSIVKAQNVYLPGIARGSKVLIAGGGTGRVLEELNQSAHDLFVTFVEPSSAMMEKARSRCYDRLHVEFITADHTAILNQEYDVLITHFLLDLFDEDHLPRVMAQLATNLKSSGIWIFADFDLSNKWMHKGMMWLMYRFFRLTANVEGKHLPDIPKLFQQLGFETIDDEFFYSGMIRSAVYKPFPARNAPPGCLYTNY